MGGLLLLALGFMVSMVDRIFFNDGVNITRPDLESLIAATSYEKQTGHKIEVVVKNGCGISKVAILYTDFLRAEGYDVVDYINADHFSYDQTQIIQFNGEPARAQSLAKLMEIDPSKITGMQDPYILHDLTLIIGHDYKELGSYHPALVHQSRY